jgi:hypothetical protein
MQVQFNRLVPVSFLIIVVFGVAAAAVAKTSSVVVPASLGVLFLALSGLAMLMRASANRAGSAGTASWSSKVPGWTGIAILALLIAALVFIALRSV